MLRYYSQKGVKMEKEKTYHSQPNTDRMSQRNFSNDQRQVPPLMMVVMLLKLLQYGTERYVLLWDFFFKCRSPVISADIVCCSAAGAHQ
jgi:hypothetical protein